MLAIVNACAIIGLDGTIVEVQTDFNPRAGIPTFSIVGLPDNAVKESRERVRTAIKNSNLSFPNSTQDSQYLFLVPLPLVPASGSAACIRYM